MAEVDRRLLARGELGVAGAEGVTAGWVAAALDRRRGRMSSSAPIVAAAADGMPLPVSSSSEDR